MTGNVSMASAAANPLELQQMMRQIKRTSVENAVKTIDVPKPRLSHPLPGSNYGARISMYA